MITTNRSGSYPGETDICTIIETHTEDGQLVSALYASPETGQIMAIETQPEFRGEGYARGLITYAIDKGIDLLHSPVWACTDEGAAFAESVTEIDVIDDEDAYGWEEYSQLLVA